MKNVKLVCLGVLLGVMLQGCGGGGGGGSSTTTPPVVPPVVPPNPPVVSLVRPIASDTFAAPAQITLEASASSADASIVKVEFFAGSAKVGTVTTPPYQLTLDNLTGAYYDFSSVATDSNGLKTISAVTRVFLSGTFVKLAFSPSPLPSFQTVPANYYDASGALPPGYVVDTGAAFGAQANGYSYGWTNGLIPTAYTPGRRPWSVSYPDRRYQVGMPLDTRAAYRNAQWEIGLPNGNYTLRALVGYEGWPPGGPFTFGLNADGTGTPQTFINTTLTQAAMVQSLWGKADSFTVTNGKLVLNRVAGNFRLHAVEVLTAGDDRQPPDTPSGINAAEVRGNSAHLYWNATQDNMAVDHYEIYNNGVLAGSTEGPRFLLAGLNASTAYAIRVLAVDLAGNKSVLSSPYILTTGADDAVSATLTSSAPVINAVKDSGEWSATEFSTGLITGTCTALKADFQTKWDANKLYVFATITSDDPVLNGADLLELYFDINNTRSLNYSAGDYQFHFFPATAMSQDNNLSGKGAVTFSTAAGEYATNILGGGSGVGTQWTFEAAIPWNKISSTFVPAPGKQIGFELHVKNSAGTCIAGYSERTIEKAWLTPQRFGTLVLR